VEHRSVKSMGPQTPDQERLVGPFVFFEEDDDDALFFQTLGEVLEDRDDILWGDRYVGYDARGTRFAVRRVTRRRPILFGLLHTNASLLELNSIDDGNFADEARSRIAAWLHVSSRECVGQSEATSWRAKERTTYSRAALTAKPLEELLRLGLEWARDEPET
jgi:hypothetical protein